MVDRSDEDDHISGLTLEEIGHRAGGLAVEGALLVAGNDIHYDEHRPPPELRGPLVSIWRSRVGDGRSRWLRLVPDGCAELSCSNDGNVVVFGPTTTWSDLTLEAGSRFDGVRLRAGAGRHVLGVDVEELTNQIVDARELPLPKLLTRPSPRDWLSSIFAHTKDRVPAFLADEVASIAPRRLARTPRRSIPELAHSLNTSERQFRRRFEREVGVPPATYRRITRMQAAMAAAMTDPARSLTAIAHDHRYADQAHLARDVSILTGSSPTALRSRRG